MALPTVAIVGRPNVGKSSLLNCLAGRTISIVDPTAGVTRDRVSTPLPLGDDVYVELVDTGGLGIEDADNLTEHVETQILYAMAEARLVLFVVDVAAGVLPLDKKVAELLRKQELPVILVVNKCDTPTQDALAGEFHQLGFGAPVLVSAEHKRGRDNLLELITQAIGHAAEPMGEPVIKLAIVGKRNAGKSTFINALAGQERVIVSETPGTTRDSVDVRFTLGDAEMIAIDTAGVRKKRRMTSDNIEYYGYHRAQRSIRRADVTLLLIDATVPLGQVDKELAGYIIEEFAPVIIAVNKWDLVGERATQEDYADYIGQMLPHLAFAPISFVSAAEGLNLSETVRLAQHLHAQASTRVSTGVLNRAVEEVLALRGPSQKRGRRRPRVYYATQVDICPPTLVLFVNDPDCFTGAWQRFLLNELRERLPFPEVPIRLLFRRRNRRDENHGSGA
ncbi:MAG: ribosome biogenesis GTPase Der [Planctomycetes bacterium]|nr:ribosome biogenesis GTPase Der [Planctomycetota bacterium]